MKKLNSNDVLHLHDMLAKLDAQLDDINHTLSRQSNTLVKHDENLKEHMRRTELLETEVAPIKKHVYMVQGVAAFLGILALLATIWTAVK